MTEISLSDVNECPSLLIVDDDQVFCDVLAKAMKKRGFSYSSMSLHSVLYCILVAVQPILLFRYIYSP